MFRVLGFRGLGVRVRRLGFMAWGPGVRACTA